MRRFLAINPFGIGDVLFTTPVIRSIKKAYPDSFIGYWCNQRTQGVLSNNPYIDKIFALSRGDLKKVFARSWFGGVSAYLKLFKAIKGSSFDISLDFSLDHRYSFISKLAGIRARLGFDYKGRGRFLTEKIHLEAYGGRPAAEYYLELLKFTGIEPFPGGLDLFVPAGHSQMATEMLSGFGIKHKDVLIGIAAGAGASWGKEAYLKHWPAEKFAQLAEKLSGELGAKVLILGDSSERHISGLIVNSTGGQIIDLTAKTDLMQLAAIIGKLDILVANDGGPLHMAVALGKKTVSIFGPVDERVYGPYPASGMHKVITKDVDCRPCYKDFRIADCKYGRRCLVDLEVDAVFHAVKELI